MSPPKIDSEQPRNQYSSTELRAVEFSLFGSNRQLWLGVAAVLAPLIVMLVLQYRWLVDLERSSTIARQATLENYLSTVTQAADYSFIKTAERFLNLPSVVFDDSAVDTAARFFETKTADGIDTLFVLVLDETNRLYFYDRAAGAMVEPDRTAKALAVWAATSSWFYLSHTIAEVEFARFSVDERDPQNRIIFNPITDEQHRLVGIAGLIVDQKYFIDTVLPEAIAESLPQFDTRDHLWVCVRDSSGRRVFPTQPCSEIEEDRAKGAFSFIFRDWTVSLQGRLSEPESWARTNFAINITLSAALSVVLLGGLGFALRAALREMRLSSMKNEFVSNVSHELRTPLASIRVFGELMRHGRVADPNKVREYGSHIEAESRRLTQLINNILDFSSIESGRRVYSFESTDFEKLVLNSVAAFSVRLRDRGMELDYEEPEEELPHLQLDSGAMDHAVANLLDNAVKYSDSNGIIGIRLEHRGNEAVLSISDQGVGIPAEELERIFERFHRVSTGLVHNVKGSGLGLSLVRHIVRAHGGRVEVVSEVGKGSTFAIYLPIDGNSGDTERRAAWQES